MTLQVREASDDDLGAILALTAEDSQHYFDEPAEVSPRQRAALAEITADPNQQMLVGQVDGQIACTAQVTWMRMLSADGASTARSRRSVRRPRCGVRASAHG